MSDQSPSVINVFSLNCLANDLISIIAYSPHNEPIIIEEKGKIFKIVAAYFIEIILWVIFSEKKNNDPLLILMEHEDKNEIHELVPKPTPPQKQSPPEEEVENQQTAKSFSIKELADMLINDPQYIPADIIVFNQKKSPPEDWEKCLIKKILRIILLELEEKNSPFMGFVSIDGEPSKFWLKPINCLLEDNNSQKAISA